jgi:hypothetical protein
MKNPSRCMDESGRRMTDLRRRIEPAMHMAQAGLPGRIPGRLIEVRPQMSSRRPFDLESKHCPCGYLT